MSVLERLPFLAQNAVFRKLAEISDINALSKEEHKKYDESIKVMRDNIATFEYAIKSGEERGEARGLKLGEARGLKLGEARGLKLGEERGKKSEKISIATNLLAMGMDLTAVSQVTGLSLDELNKLQLS